MSLQIVISKSIEIQKLFGTGRPSIITNGTVIRIGNVSDREDVNNFFNKKIKPNSADATIEIVCLEKGTEQKRNELGLIAIDGEITYKKANEHFYLKGRCLLNFEDWHELTNDISLIKYGALMLNIKSVHAGALIETANSIQTKVQLSLKSYSLQYNLKAD